MNAIITGATKGMGKAIALKLAASNYNLFLCSRNAEELEVLKRELQESFPAISVFVKAADVGNSTDLEEFAQFIKSQNLPIDLLVNNAGMFLPATILQEVDNTLEQQLAVNLVAPHYLCKVFGNEMKARRRGHIINICSIASINPVVNAGSYSVTKYALLGLTRVLREELMQHGVKVTAILPGSTLTGSWTGTTLPHDRFIDPQDVANAVLLCVQASKGGNVDEIVIRPTHGNI